VLLVLRHPRIGWALVLLGSLGGALSVALGHHHAILEALGVSSGVAGWSQRLEIWQRALWIIEDFTYTGVGFGRFQEIVRRHYPLFSIKSGTVSHAHNLFLQMAVDVGLPGLALFCLTLGVAMIGALQSVRQRGRPRPALALAAATTSALAGIAAHGLLDNALWGNKTSLLLWLVIALGLALTRRARVRQSP
jgi:putative inorganic carbon (HCO3(-)) transporter